MERQSTELAKSFWIKRAEQHAAAYRLAFVREHRSDFDALEAELSNIHASIDWCIDQDEWQLTAQFTKALNEFWLKSGYWYTCLRYNRHVLLSNTLESDDEKVEVMGQVAFLEEQTGNYEEARRFHEQQLEHLRQIGRPDAISKTLEQLASLAMSQGDDIAAQRYLESQLALAQRQHNAKDQVDILCELVALHHRGRDLLRADLLCQQGLEIGQRIGYMVGLVDILRQQASIRRTQRRYRDARKLYRAALDAALKMGDQVRAGEIRGQLTVLESAMGRHIFISYNHHDRYFAERLARDLRDAGFSVWWDQWEIKVGDSIIEKVNQGIHGSAYLAVVLSPHSVRSDWVKREVGSALMNQLSAKRRITVLPLLIADCEIPPLLREIKRAEFRQDYESGLREVLDAVVEQEPGQVASRGA